MDLLISLLTVCAALTGGWLVRDALRELGQRTPAGPAQDGTAIQPDAGLVERLRRTRSVA